VAVSRASRLPWGSARQLADRVADVVWAAGDCTAFSAKTGGFAAEQADVAAAGIAAAAGASVQERQFDPMLR
jgi:sulfide:quinone oxidoreductase